MLGAARLLYGMGTQGALPRFFAFVSPSTSVPSRNTRWLMTVLLARANRRTNRTGGTGVPLVWQSLQRLLDSGSDNQHIWRCYERRITNKSDRDVTDVFWKVAGFERDFHTETG
jgi:hypothetical protein